MIWKGKENFPSQLTAGQELKRVAIEPHKKVSFVNASSDASEAPYTNCSKGHDTTQNEILEMQKNAIDIGTDHPFIKEVNEKIEKERAILEPER